MNLNSTVMQGNRRGFLNSGKPRAVKRRGDKECGATMGPQKEDTTYEVGKKSEPAKLRSKSLVMPDRCRNIER